MLFTCYNLIDPSYSPPGTTQAAAVIASVVGSTEGKVFFLCGPQGLYDFCLPVLEKMGIPRIRLRKEMYGTPGIYGHFPAGPVM